MSVLEIEEGGGGGVRQSRSNNFTIAVDAIVSTETVLNSVIHKQTLPSSPKVFGDFDARVLLEANGLLLSFDPEIKRQISNNLNTFFASGYASHCGTTRDF